MSFMKLFNLRRNKVNQAIEYILLVLVLVWSRSNLYYRCLCFRKNRNVDGYLWTILQDKKDVMCIYDPFMENIVNETMKIACECRWLCELEVICIIDVYILKKNRNANAYSWTILQGKRWYSFNDPFMEIMKNKKK